MMAPVMLNTARNAPATIAIARCSCRTSKRMGRCVGRPWRAARPESVVAEHFGAEAPQFRTAFRRVARQSGLAACLRDERVDVPAPLGRDLRQQQAALPALLHQQAVTADLDLVRPRNQLERT